MATLPIPLSSADITEVERAAVLAVLDSGRLSLGPQMEAFEAAVSAATSMPHAVAVSSGTAGLHLSLLALGIGPADAVIVPSFTFIAAANAIRYVGATPVFVDIDPLTRNMDPAAVARAITPSTRALLVVHTFGLPAEMDTLMAIARQHNLVVLEDACEALGATYRGRPVGSFGDCAVFAFYPNKQITTGEGGMIVTPHAAVARELRALRNQGRYPTDDWLQHSILGYNYRLSEINCALGCAQMSRLGELLDRRAAVAARYRRALAGAVTVTLPPDAPAHATLSWFVYVVELAAIARQTRDHVVQAMASHGVQCGRYFAPVHQQPAYRELAAGVALPQTEDLSQRTLALPFYATLGETAQSYVVDTLLSLL